MASDFVTVIGLAVLLGSVVAVLWRTLDGPEVQRVSRRVRCPLTGRAADCVLLRNVRTGGWESVLHCPLRLESGPCACASPCLRVLELKTDLGQRAASGARHDAMQGRI